MACILINDEVQSTLTMKDLEKAIHYIFSTEEKQIIISPEGGIGYISRKEYAERNFSKLINVKKILIKKLLIVFIVINLLVNS